MTSSTLLADPPIQRNHRCIRHQKYKVKLDRSLCSGPTQKLYTIRPQCVLVFIYQFKKSVIFYKPWTSLLHKLFWWIITFGRLQVALSSTRIYKRFRTEFCEKWEVFHMYVDCRAANTPSKFPFKAKLYTTKTDWNHSDLFVGWANIRAIQKDSKSRLVWMCKLFSNCWSICQ